MLCQFFCVKLLNSFLGVGQFGKQIDLFFCPKNRNAEVDSLEHQKEHSEFSAQKRGSKVSCSHFAC